MNPMQEVEVYVPPVGLQELTARLARPRGSSLNKWRKRLGSEEFPLKR